MEVRSRAEVLWVSVEVRSETAAVRLDSEVVLSGWAEVRSEMVEEVESGREWP
jgi:hypothetical protein